jgi:hypothetical protein
MADLSITPSNVAAQPGATTRAVAYGEAITPGIVVYEDSADGEAKAADCTSADTDAVAGIALNGGGDGQPGKIVTDGDVSLGAVLTVGTIYVLSESGAIAPAADLVADDYVSVLGVAVSTSLLRLAINNSGVQVPV